MHILIAPNAFKNSLNAEDAALAIEKGFISSKLECSIECFPVGDGGDGTAELIVKRCAGLHVVVEVANPFGRKINAVFGLIDDGKTAVIEMANASGLRLLKPQELNPLRALSTGTGELIKFALEKGVKKIIIGMGGSATVDGGVGILMALGVRFFDLRDVELTNLPESLVDLQRIDLSALDQRILACEVSILCDVDNFMLGETGAAKVFGPQKGADADAVKKLEAALQKLSKVIKNQIGKDIISVKRGGAAGGAAASLHGLINAKLLNGIDHFLALTNFDLALSKADIVITGEGSLDEQTLQGKGPQGVAQRARLKGLPVIGIAGKVPLQPQAEMHQYFDILIPIGNEPTDLSNAMLHTSKNLTRTSIAVANLLALGKQRG